MSQVRSKRWKRPINIHPRLVAMINIIAIYEKKKVADVCDPILTGPITERFEKLPEAVQEMASLPPAEPPGKDAAE